jgi:hypothetical protein
MIKEADISNRKNIVELQMKNSEKAWQNT